MADSTLRSSRLSHHNRQTLRIGLIMTLIFGLTIFCGTQSVQASITNPPVNTIAFQTTGRLAPLQIGDFYTQDPGTAHPPNTPGTGGENTTHEVVINIPCIAGLTYRIELFDPEVYDTGSPSDPASTEVLDDEAREVDPTEPNGQDQGPNFPDQTHFELLSPAGGSLVTQDFGPYAQPPAAAPAEHDNWIAFATINVTTGTYGTDCGPYSMETWVGDGTNNTDLNNDDNAWAYRLMGGNAGLGAETFNSNLGPDGVPGTGDEAWIGVQRLSYQHSSLATQNFWWFVDFDEFNTGIDEWVGRNFDIDTGSVNQCGAGDANCSITYNAPTLGSYLATLSAPTSWNGGSTSARGTGDPHTDALGNTEWGKWRADVRTQADNQYIFEVENPVGSLPNQKPIFLTDMELPDVNITKDDGVYEVLNGDTLTYVLRIENTGTGAAMPIEVHTADLPEVRDTIPPGTTFVSCGITAPLVGTCSENPAGSGNVEFQLTAQDPANNVLAYLPSPNSGRQSYGLLEVVVTVDNPPPPNPGDLLENISEVRWTDIYRDIYPPRQDNDIDIVGPADLFDLELEKSVSDSTAYIGQTVTYTIVLTNQGPEPAIGTGAGGAGITVTDLYPTDPNLGAPTNVTVTGDPGAVYDTGTDTLTLSQPLAVGASVTVTYEATVNGALTNVRNIAQVDSAAPTDIDSTPGNLGADPVEDDEDDAIISASAATDLELDVTVDTPTANIGDTVTFDVTFTHTPVPATSPGPVTAEVQITFPPNLAIDPTAIVVPPGTTFDPNTGIWTITNLAEYGSVTLQIPGTVLVTDPQTLTGEVVSSTLTDIDADPNNNDPTEDDQDSAAVNAGGTTGGAGAGGGGGGGGSSAVQTDNSAFTKHGAPDTAVIGETVTWTITINNPGSTAIDPGAVTDNVPAQFDIISATASQGTASSSGNTIVANPGTINAGDTVTITIQTIVNSLGEPGEICNWASMLGFVSSLPQLGPGGALMAPLAQVTWTAEDCIILFPDLLPATGGNPISDNWWLWLTWIAVTTLVGIALWRLRTTRQPIRVKVRRRKEDH